MTVTTDNLTHAEHCNAERVETTDYPDHGITTSHCLDCGAHAAQDRDGKTIVTPVVTGAQVGHGRGDMDVSLERMPAGHQTRGTWPTHADKEII